MILWDIWAGCAQASYSTLPFLNIPPNKAPADPEAFDEYEDIHENESNSQDAEGSNQGNLAIIPSLFPWQP